MAHCKNTVYKVAPFWISNLGKELLPRFYRQSSCNSTLRGGKKKEIVKTNTKIQVLKS